MNPPMVQLLSAADDRAGAQDRRVTAVGKRL